MVKKRKKMGATRWGMEILMVAVTVLAVEDI